MVLGLGGAPLFCADFLRLNKETPAAYAALEKLILMYSEPGRHYHNLVHLDQGVKDAEELGIEMEYTDFMAWAYHDSIYDPMSKDNEKNSALFFMEESRALGIPFDQADTIAQKILQTTHASGTSLITDIDLAILGKSPGEYNRYAENIRKEYAAIPDGAFNEGRSAILRRLLARPRLYGNALFREKYEHPARVNIEWEIGSLDSARGMAGDQR